MAEEKTKIRVLVVDDSPFSRAILINALPEEEFEVVGEAEDLSSVLAQYSQHRPDVVTMDVAMPDLDGIGCTARLRKEHPEAKVVIVSSMWDEAMAQEAKAQGACGYLQKPVQADELVAALREAIGLRRLPEELDSLYPGVFAGALVDNLNRCGISFSQEDLIQEAKPGDTSLGITILVGITGEVSGRMAMDLSYATASELARSLLKREPKRPEEVHQVMAEFANIVAGHATSRLNKQFKGLALRVSPPGIITGEGYRVISPHIHSATLSAAIFDGKVVLSVGFKKEEVAWT